MTNNGKPTNGVLAALPPDGYRAIAKKLQPLDLELKQILFDVDRPIEYVYFPEGSVISIVAALSDKTAIETATIGKEGMVGLPVFLGTDRTNAQAFVQIPGPAKRMRADDFLEAVGKLPTLGDVLHRYTQALFTMVAQTSACNRLHMMTERCARWLLHTHDRVGGGPFPLTHQFLSQMLGVRRASVSEAMHALQNYGVSYSNGLVTIEDRDALESAACECYAVVINEFNRLLRDRANRPENAPKDPLDGVPTSENGHTVLDAPLPETADD